MDLNEITKNIDNSGKDLTSDTKSICINQHDLFSDFPMTHCKLKDWKNYFIMCGEFQSGLLIVQ